MYDHATGKVFSLFSEDRRYGTLKVEDWTIEVCETDESYRNVLSVFGYPPSFTLRTFDFRDLRDREPWTTPFLNGLTPL